MKTEQVVATVEQHAPVAQTSNEQRTLYIMVKVYDTEGAVIGSRVVDMYHYGTRNWLQKHMWWAMHNGHMIGTHVAEEKDVRDYLATQAEALKAKFDKAAA